MALWLNHVAIAAPRNGLTTHTVNPASGTTAAGTLFTPTAGRFLVVIAQGAVTSTTPTPGWTLEASAINNTGLYAWSRTAAGSDTLTTTHNAANYPVIFHWFEFTTGSTWVNDITSTTVTQTGVHPDLTGLTGTNLVMAAKGCAEISGAAAFTGTWGGSTLEILDTTAAYSTTDGYWLHIGYIEDSAASSYQPTSTRSNPVDAPGTHEAITWAILPAAVTATPTYVAKGTFTTGAAGLSVPPPAGIANNDLLICVVTTPNETITTPSGYTQVTNSPQSTGTIATAGGIRIGVFYKFTTGTEANLTVADTGTLTIAQIHAFRGTHLTTPINITAGSVDAATTASLSAPGVTTTVADCLIVHCIGLDKDLADVDTLSAPTNANLTSITERHDETVATATGGGLAVITGIKATAGATGNTTITGDTATTHAYVTIALAPPSTGPSTQTITLPAIASTTVLHTPITIVRGPVTITLPHIASTTTLHTPIVVTPTITVTLPHIPTTATLHPPTVTAGAVTVTLPHIASTTALYEPTVTLAGIPAQTLTLPHIASTTTLHPPTVTTGAVTVTLPHIPSTTVLHTPITIIRGAVTVTLPTIASTTVLHAPTVTAAAVTVTLPHIASTTVLYPPTVTLGIQTIVLPHIAATPTATAYLGTIPITTMFVGTP